MQGMIDYGQGIWAVDSNYLRPQLDAIHLIVENGHVAVIDCAVNSSVPHILAALRDCGLRETDVDGSRGHTLEVRASNAGAIRLYESLGFRPSGMRRGYYTDNREDALIMWRGEGPDDLPLTR